MSHHSCAKSPMQIESRRLSPSRTSGNGCSPTSMPKTSRRYFALVGRCGHFPKFAYGVKLHRLPTDPDAPKPVTLTRETLAKVNPTTGTMPIFRSMTDLGIVAKIYDSSPVLIEGTGRNETPAWPIKYRQMINMTSRSEGFRTASMLTEQAGAWPAGIGESA